MELNPADIIAARRRIAGIVQPTPLEYSRPLSALTGAEVFLKLECAQVTGSFKVRGASNALRLLPPDTPVVACSAGNHALGMAHAAAELGRDVTLVVPEDASPAKIAALGRYPVRLLLHGKGYDAAEAAALRLAREEGLRFISPYNHPDVIAGQGTVAVELFEQLPDRAIGGDTREPVLLVGVGGGGLIAGVGLWARAVSPATRLIGVQAANSAAMYASLQVGRIVTAPDQPTLADGLAGNIEPGSITFPLVQRLVDQLILVSEDQIARAMLYLLDEHHVLVEGSAAVVVAALIEGLIPAITGCRVIALLCGRNVASSVLFSIAAGRF